MLKKRTYIDGGQLSLKTMSKKKIKIEKVRRTTQHTRNKSFRLRHRDVKLSATFDLPQLFYRLLFTVYRLHFTIYLIHVSFLQFYLLPFTVYNSPFTFYLPYFTVYNLQFTVYRLQFDIPQRTIYNSACTVYRLPFTVAGIVIDILLFIVCI